MTLLHDTERTRASRFPLCAAVVVGLGAAAGAFWHLTRPAPEPAATAPAPSQPRSAPASGRTGTVEVSSDRSDAVVFLDGGRLGGAPARAEDISSGAHRVRVEAPGRAPIEREVHVLPGRVSSVSIVFGETPPRLVVLADVEGASVFLDRTFLGYTPLSIDVSAGSRELQVSAEGYPPHNETLELASGRTLERHLRLKQRPPLSAEVAVEHRHGMGSCSGTLRATDAGLEYRSAHKDAFSVPLSSLERFEIDYLDHNLEVKARGGRRYNFRGDADALLVFQREVSARIP